MDFKDETTLSRRTFVKGSLAGLALAGAAGSAALYGCTPAEEKEQSGEGAPAEEADQIVWGQCFVNCGSNCALRYHVRDGKILYLEPTIREIPKTLKCGHACAGAHGAAGSTPPIASCIP